jgi:hypothetical protein
LEKEKRPAIIQSIADSIFAMRERGHGKWHQHPPNKEMRKEIKVDEELLLAEYGDKISDSSSGSQDERERRPTRSLPMMMCAHREKKRRRWYLEESPHNNIGMESVGWGCCVGRRAVV